LEQTAARPDALDDANQPTTDRLPRRRRGGQELPDDVQDRPEQNEGYDAAVRGDSATRAEESAEELDIESGGDRGLHIRQIPDELPADERPVESADDRAERETIAEIRRRERRR
jgi:hypothetical protein